MERIEATCPCGATFKVESSSALDVKQRYGEWQEKHTGHIAPAPAPVIEAPVPPPSSFTPRPITLTPLHEWPRPEWGPWGPHTTIATETIC